MRYFVASGWPTSKSAWYLNEGPEERSLAPVLRAVEAATGERTQPVREPHDIKEKSRSEERMHPTRSAGKSEEKFPPPASAHDSDG